MPRDEDLLELDELAALLREHEGPAEPSPAHRRTARRRIRFGGTVGVAAGALLVGSGLGFGLASSLTPSGGAAQPGEGLGFVPERGWYVLSSRFEATAARPSFAIASNVPLHPLDAKMSRRPDWSGTPHQALRTLRPGGIVILASFSLRGVHEPSDESFPRRALPLRLRDAARTPGGWPQRPLATYEIRAAVGDHNAIVAAYFGSTRPSRASTIAAQRQLDRLVVGSTSTESQVDERAFPLHPGRDTRVASSAASRLVDRTFSCAPIAFGGIGDLDVNVSPLRKDPIGRQFVTMLEVRTGARSADGTLVVARALKQPEHPGLAYNSAVGGAAGVFAHAQRCTSARAAVPLSSRGLAGPPLAWQKELDCPVRGRVLVRVRSVLRSPDEWGRVDRVYAGVSQPLVESKLAVRLQKTGKPIAYLEHDANGKTKLWHAGGCS